VNTYYEKEKEAYHKILSDFPRDDAYKNVSALSMANSFGYSKDEMDLFLGFLDGINQSLLKPLELGEVDDHSVISLEIDFEKLYLNMRDAKADWLYGLSSWKNVFPTEKLDHLSAVYRESKIVRSDKIGRNDPCPCGSGKKYKQCCMNK